MQTTQGSLVIINAHTQTPEVFWNGIRVEGVRRMKLKFGENDGPMKIVVASTGTQEQIYAEMLIAGIQVKRAVP